ncbi:Uncharacterised protein [Candidatus Venteria ishoeyi]|uniref:Uncharacterized protein n=1 Tax=Candidatus Venteria ishoeyi TaxID=1899563 RepID=A0A1H6FA62_9GAMM|nr:Uncharacterised protein [Candidatus Venteria ishoeyi]
MTLLLLSILKSQPKFKKLLQQVQEVLWLKYSQISQAPSGLLAYRFTDNTPSRGVIRLTYTCSASSS